MAPGDGTGTRRAGWTARVSTAGRSRTRGLAFAAMLATVLAGCGATDDRGPDGAAVDPTDGGTSQVTGGADQQVRTPEQIAALIAYETAVGERLTADGTVPVDLALDLFAGSFGPVDGGDPEAVGPAPGSATLAVFAVLGTWDELTDAQRTGVTEVMNAHLADTTDPADGGETGAAGTDTDTVAQAAGQGRVVAAHAATTSVTLEDLRAWATELQADIELLLGEDLSIPVRVVERRRAAGSDTLGEAIAVQAEAWPVDEHVDGCRVVMYTRDGDSRTQLRATLAHELFHCFQFTAVADSRYPDVPTWIIEGSAEFVAATIAPGASGAFWDEWLGDPGRSLFARSYSALGVFAVAQQSGSDPWETMLPMMRTGSSRSALELLFGTDADVAMRTVARALVREPQLGAGWESVGPDITPTRGTTDMAVGGGDTLESTFPLRRYATAPATVDVSGSVIDVTILNAHGSLALPGGTTVDVGRGFMARYCVTGSCECPDGGTVHGVEIPSDGLFGVGLTSLDPVTDAGFRFVVLTPEEACENPPAGEMLVIHFDRPTTFEIHGGVCTVQASGDLLILGGDGRYPEGYTPPEQHRDDASMSIYKNPSGRADGGSVSLTLGGAEVGGGSTIHLDGDLLGGTFVLESGYAGWWRCPELLTPEEAFGNG